jgi:hypothetical protein
MPLHWNVEKCKDVDSLFNEIGKDDPEGRTEGNKYLKKIPEVIILLTPAIDMGEITQKNALEFLTRIRIIENLDGCFINHKVNKAEAGKQSTDPDEWEPYHITYEDVWNMVGMHTNVITRGRGIFMKKIAQRIARDAEREAKSSMKDWGIVALAETQKGAQK